MIRRTVWRAIGFVLLATALTCGPGAIAAAAQANRTFVSAVGNDGNACTAAAPCRTLQTAFNAAAPSGEIEVLDPTGYGALVITHAITIEGHGWASMNASGGAPVITINAPAADKISLRGLVIVGFGANAANGAGIQFNTGGTLDIRDTLIRNVFNGIQFKPTTAADLVMTDTRVIGTSTAVNIDASSVAVTGTLNRVWIVSNGTGLLVTGGTSSVPTTVVVSDSELSGNACTGLAVVSSNANLATRVTVRNSNLSHNGCNGVQAANLGAFVLVTRSTVTGNGAGFLNDGGGAIESYVDNALDGNNANGAAGAPEPYR
jgi:3D (Asp-Asp-Asp) domain-containing protein